MRAFWLALVVLTAACGSATYPTANVTPSSPSQAAASTTPSTSPAPVLCRMPIDTGDGGQLVDVLLSGLSEQRPGRFATDPTSRAPLPDGEPATEHGYSWAIKRWLPVRSQWVSPDGAHYAYSDVQGRLHVVSTSNNSDQVIASGASWGVYGVDNDAIYAGRRAPDTTFAEGLWRISISRGAAHQLAANDTWSVISGGFAWAADLSDQHVASSARIGGPGFRPDNPIGDTLRRIDLATGEITDWVRPGPWFSVVTVDASGRPILLASEGLPQFRIFVVVAQGAVQSFEDTFVADVMADSHGIWVWVPYGGFATLSTAVDAGTPAVTLPNDRPLHFAGPCR